jgi:type II secretory pathway pseudopilin PulG
MHARRSSERGYALIMALLMIVAIGLASTSAVLRWQTEIQRERERQLRFVGAQYADAIASYYLAVPAAKQYPRSLDDLLDDKRFPAPRRHLRRKYPDPMTGLADWALIVQDGRVIGLHSRSTAYTLKQERGAPSTTYADWEFVAAAVATGSVSLDSGTSTPAAEPTPSVPLPSPVVIYNPAPPSSDDPSNCSAQYQDALRVCTNTTRGAAQFAACRASAVQALRACRQAGGN